MPSAVDDVRALTQKILEPAGKGDFGAFVEALDDDLEVFDHIPWRFEDKPSFIQHLMNITIGAERAAFSLYQPSFRAISDGVVVVNAYDQLVTTPKAGGYPRMQSGRTTWVFAKRAGGWKITSAHFSPVYLEEQR